MIMLTGGSGRLGKEIRKLMPDVWAPTREEFDVTGINGDLEKIMQCRLIVHAAAYTNVDGAEHQDRELCYKTNVLGTRRVAHFGVPVLYISTDAVFDGERGNYSENDVPYPQNFYSLTKYLGELEVKNGVILRCSPKTIPWAHEVAFTDRFFSALYYDDAAKAIAHAVSIFKLLPRVIHVGTERRSHYDMACETRHDVRPVSSKDFKVRESAIGVRRGRDLSLDCSFWKALQ